MSHGLNQDVYAFAKAVALASDEFTLTHSDDLDGAIDQTSAEFRTALQAVNALAASVNL